MGLAGLVAYETMQIETLQQQVEQGQQTIAELKEEVREKQQGQIQELDQEVRQEHNLTFLALAGTFTLLTCLISMFHMSSHLNKMNQPIIQRKIISILWMSPIYSVTSFLSLIYTPLEGYMAIIKDFYESYCIYNFLSFLILVLGRGSRENAVEALALHAQRLERPTRFLSRWYEPPPESSDLAMANAVITECQIYAMQFVFIRPLTTVLWVMYEAFKAEGGHVVFDNTNDNNRVDNIPTSAPAVIHAVNHTGTRMLRWLQNGAAAAATVAANTTAAVLANSTTSEFEEDGTFTGTYAPSLSPILEPSPMIPVATPTFDSTFAPFGNEFTNPPTVMEPPPENFTEATKAYFKSFGFVLAMIVNVSVFFAFTGLLKFYHSVHQDLAWIRPWPKFLTIKGVVFLTFWQGLAILIFVNLREGNGGGDSSIDNDDDDPSTKGRRYQNILICCEMLFFSLTHWCVFPAEEWEKDYKPPEQVNTPGIGIQDFVSDVGQIYRNGRKRRKPRHRRRNMFLGNAKKSSPSREDAGSGLYYRPTTASHMSATIPSIDDDLEDSNSSYCDEDLQMSVTGPLPNGVRLQAYRHRLMSDDSSVKADDEDDDIELL